MTRLAIAALVLLALAGCGQLRLEVRVLDPQIVKNLAQDDRVRKELPIRIAETDAEIIGGINETQNKHFAAYIAAATRYRKQAEALPKGDKEGRQRLTSAAASLDELPEPITMMYAAKQAALLANRKVLEDEWKAYKEAGDEAAEIRQKLKALTKEEREATRTDFAALSDSTAKGRARNKLIVSLDERQNIESSLIRAVQLDVQELEKNAEDALSQAVVPSNNESIASSIATQERAAQNAVTTVKQLFSHGGLPLSPYAYYVASAPAEAWAEDYDRSKAHGYFGNTDIAIKALGEGNYTLKGVSFNPADVASAASKVGTQMVMLAAQMNGVPVRLSSSAQTAPTPPATPTDGTALATSSTRVANVLQEQGVAAEKLAAQRDALLRIAAAILREKKMIETGSGEPLRAALQAIKASYDSHAPRLTISASDAGTKP